jgi:hypothetical protein
MAARGALDLHRAPLNKERTDMNSNKDPVAGPVRPWWRYPMVWLVIGGPFAVVLASLATLLIALTHPDPVLPLRAAAPEAAQPAVQARNHAANPR